MSKKDEIKRLWADTFGDSREFVDMYFDRVYRDSDAMTILSDDGHLVSSLLLQPYSLFFHKREASVSYIAGAMTRRNMRGRGLMTSLMIDALEASRGRGDLLTLLIPASDYLYSYYARFGFAAVVFTDIMRYTSLPSFAPADSSASDDFTPVENIFDDKVYEAMAAMERDLKQSVVLHSYRDFLNILDDLRLDGGRCEAVADSDGNVVAIGWARPAPDGSGSIQVDELLYRSAHARQAVLRRFRLRWPDKPFAVKAPVADDNRRPTRRAMARIVNIEAILGLLAEAYPHLSLNLRIADTLIPANDGVFSIAAGKCSRRESSRATRLDFDIDVVTLAEILFSSPEIGNVMDIPARRLHMALMLD